MQIIADDITGAAEIAGIAWRKGMKVRLMVYQPNMPTTPLSSWKGAGVEALILATDTRSGTEEEAVKTIEELAICLYSGVQTLPSSTSNSSTRQLVNLSTDASNLSTCQLVNSSTDIIFKKTDSVLRGHVAAELQALMRVTGKNKSLLIPQNPSKGRIVKDGIYYINGTPLDQTSFAYDPEFPAKTSLVNKLISRRVDELCASENSGHSITNNLSTCQLDYLSTEISLPDATTLEEIREHVANADPNTLFAGGADMFEAVVEYLLGVQEFRSAGVQTLPGQGVQTLPSSTNNSSTCEALNSSTEKILILCGSTQSRSLIGEHFFSDKNTIEVTMPEDVFHGTASIHETNAWIATLKDHWQNHDAMIVRIGHEATGGKEYAVRLRNLFGEMAYQILSPDQGVQEFRSAGVQTLPSSTSNLSTNIILEGGATAYTVLQRLGISSFDVEYEYSPGVVCLSHGNMRIILKPGSYPWGNLFEEL